MIFYTCTILWLCRKLNKWGYSMNITFPTLFGPSTWHRKTFLAVWRFSRSIFLSLVTVTQVNWAISWQNQQNDMCAQRRLRSAWASTQVWLESSLSAWRKLGSSAIHWAHSKDWSDWADAQADLTIHWVHSHFVGFVIRQLNYEK